MGYKHGIYGSLIASTETITNTKNVPVYVGVAPVHRVVDRVVNKPQLIRSLQEAETKLGYKESDDFDEFSLSAVIYAHFQNKIQAIGPIVIINVLDPSRGTLVANEIVPIINGEGVLDEHVVIDSVSVLDKTIGIDYTLEYNEQGFLKIKGTNLGDSITVSYKTVLPGGIIGTDIIGSYNSATEERTGIRAIADVYEELNLVPSIIAAPGFSQIPAVEQALVATTSKISDKWEAICFNDIDSDVATTLDQALAWKKENNYTSNYEKICWPKGIVAGKEIWLSICAIVAKLQTDVQNDNIPFETPSNKAIDISGLIANGNKIKISQSRANELNEKGITTSIYSAGRYVLWGPHMANYEYGITNKPEEIFDVNIMMNKHLLNDFQLRNGEIIDSTMTRHDVDSLMNSEQLILNAYVSSGKLLFGEITFNEDSNPTSDVISGDFTFNTLVTNTPLAKSITQKVQYTSKGIDTIYGGDE